MIFFIYNSFVGYQTDLNANMYF